MAGQRMLHPAQSMSQRVSALNDFEYRVWEQTKLSSDDFGVLLFDATAVRAENSRLRKAPERQVKDALVAIAEAGLLLSWTHQGEVWACAPVWQTWQQVRFPRRTSRPQPDATVLGRCDEATQHLFSIHPGGCQVPKKNFEATSKPLRSSSKSLRSECEVDAQNFVVVAPEPPANANASANANADPVLVLSEGGPGETARPPVRGGVADRARALGIVSPGQWDRQHASHALRADFCDWVCLPQAVHAEFVNRVVASGSTLIYAEGRVRAWALDVKARWAGDIPGEDSFKFWRAEWAAAHPNRRPSSTPAPGAGLDALIAAGKADAHG